MKVGLWVKRRRECMYYGKHGAGGSVGEGREGEREATKHEQLLRERAVISSPQAMESSP